MGGAGEFCCKRLVGQGLHRPDKHRRWLACAAGGCHGLLKMLMLLGSLSLVRLGALHTDGDAMRCDGMRAYMFRLSSLATRHNLLRLTRLCTFRHEDTSLGNLFEYV